MDALEHIKTATPYKDINEILYFLTQGIYNVFGSNLIGVYLTGSLSYGDFKEGRSDIDLAVVINQPATPKQIEELRQLHTDAEVMYKHWAGRVECSYIPLAILPSILPPKTPRPWWGFSKLYADAPYGDEWIVNQYCLYTHGITLLGADFKKLVEPIKIDDVKKARIRDLYQEWEPKIRDLAYLQDSHQQSYVVLHLCRILHTLKCNEVSTKKAATLWTKDAYPQWQDLIEVAEAWHYGLTMERENEVISFIKFVIAEAEK